MHNPLGLRMEVLGLRRSQSSITNIHGEDLRIIADSQYCEDLHYHEPSNLLFAASEPNCENRWEWFPPMGNFKGPRALGRGTFVVIDAETFVSKRLTLTNFEGPFITHGIDVWSPAEDSLSVFIFAVNHLPNPDYYELNNKKAPKARSQIEIFHHKIGSSKAEYLRSIWHPLIRTPNDLYIQNEHSLYITNDHLYREGLVRVIEDVAYGTLAPWTDLVHVDIKNLKSIDSSTDIDVTVAIKGLHNNNGLGRGRDENEILIGRASAGVLVLAAADSHPRLRVIDSIQLGSTIDNPSYFRDPYARETGRDASGYVLAGLARAAAFPDSKGMDPVMVWFVRADPTYNAGSPQHADKKWSKELIFQDDSTTIRSASTAVLIAIDPARNQGRKQAWLFVTGPISSAIIASKIDI